jgi:hypothetical protein
MSTELTALAALLEAHLTPLGFEHDKPHKGRLHFVRYPEGFGKNDRLERITLEEIGLHAPIVYGCAKHGDHRGISGHSFETMSYHADLDHVLSIARELEEERQVALEAMKPVQSAGPWQIGYVKSTGRSDGRRIAVINAPHPDGGGEDIAECIEEYASLIVEAPRIAAEAAEAAAVIAGFLSREDQGWCSLEGCDINVKDAIIDSAQAVARISVLGEGPWGNDSETTYNEAMKTVADKIMEIAGHVESETDWSREVAEVFASMSQPQEGVSRTGGIS